MAGNYNVNADAAQLEAWKKSVDQELDAVDAVLKEVAQVCKDCQGDDTIYGACKKLGEEIGNAWVSLTDKFRQVSDATGKLIDNIKTGASNVIGFIKDVASKFHF